MFGYDLNELFTNFILPWIFKIAAAIIILVIGWILTKVIVRLVEKYLIRYKVDEILVNFTSSLVKATLLLLVAVAALSQLGVNTTSLIALIGAAGLAIGLALQDSLKNFASGVLLIIYRPFKVGDFVEVADTQGSVEEITMFTTALKTADNREVIVPNGEIYANTIVNYSSKPIRRIDMVFGIGYEDDIRKVRQILQDILAEDERVLKEPSPLIAVAELADSSVNIYVRPWVKSEDHSAVQFALTEKIKLEFDDNGISIPYPQMDIHLNGKDGSS